MTATTMTELAGAMLAYYPFMADTSDYSGHSKDAGWIPTRFQWPHLRPGSANGWWAVRCDRQRRPVNRQEGSPEGP